MVKKIILLILVITGITVMSCSKYQKLLKNPDSDLKYSKANEYYEKKDYNRALQLYDQVKGIYAGTDKAEMIAYNEAYCYYYMKDPVQAPYSFKMFASSYPMSKYAEEGTYMAAYCLFIDSPRSSLDQTSSKDAIQNLQLFINQYPNSERVSKCNDLIDQLREKIQQKDFDIALMYYKMGIYMDGYKSAIRSFSNLLKDYPDTKEKEKIMYYIFLSKYKYGVNSIDEKRRERMRDALDAYRELQMTYPQGSFSKQASSLGHQAEKEIKI
jgi:outer membrane protein assembly factor BamD